MIHRPTTLCRRFLLLKRLQSPLPTHCRLTLSLPTLPHPMLLLLVLLLQGPMP